MAPPIAALVTDLAYSELTPAAMPVTFRGTEIQVCGLQHLPAMKRAAGRPGGREDLERLGDPRA